MEENKKILPIQDLEIKISSESCLPQVVLNGLDFKAEKIGLKGLKIIWETKIDELPETIIQVDYMQRDSNGDLQEVSISQSFRGTLLGK